VRRVFDAWRGQARAKKQLLPMVQRMLMRQQGSILTATFHAWRRCVHMSRMERLMEVVELERQRRVDVRPMAYRVPVFAHLLTLTCLCVSACVCV